ncbi:MAG: flagellar biosynthesis anti-sigma factor FlgM [Planctomycetota bacterium]|jgi:anti-sigma28 factor (negative regulator of flagellin synthesis)
MKNIPRNGKADTSSRMRRIRNIRKACNGDTATIVASSQAVVSEEHGLIKQAKNLPEVRMDRVNSIKAAINNADFNLDDFVEDAVRKMILEELGQ